LRIAVVSDYLDPNNWGGAARNAAEQALAFKDLGHEVTLIAPSGSEQLILGINHVSWLRKGRWSSVLKTKSRISSAIKDCQPELAILHQPLTAFFVQQSFPQLRTRYTFNSSWVDEVRSKGVTLGLTLRDKMQHLCLKRSEKIFVSSSYTKEILLNIDPQFECKTIENPLAVKSPPFQISQSKPDLRDKYNIPKSQSLVLCTFRRLIARTGVDLFLEVVAQMPNVFALVGGSGEDRSDLENKALLLGIQDRIIFLGYVEEELMIEILQGSDISVIPSLELEGFGLSTLESLACGCPVAATPTGNNTTLLKNCGFDKMIAQNIDATSLANCINKVVDQRYEAFQLSQTVTSNYSWIKHAETLLT